MVPPLITAIRSAMPRTSGRSLEISSTAIPSSARRRMILWISLFAPTSTPWVGSSKIRSRGPVASQRANETFCWLPPDSEPPIASGPDAFTPRSLICRSASERSAIGRSQVPGKIRSCTAIVMLSAIGISRITPWRRRSSGTYAMPRATASRGDPMVTGFPASSISPESAGVNPKRIRASSVRPAPIKPAIPTISPVPTSSVMSRSPIDEHPRRRTDSIVAPGRVEGGGSIDATSRPTISWISSFSVSVGPDRSGSDPSAFRTPRVPTLSPSRRTVTRSASAKISSSRWEM